MTMVNTKLIRQAIYEKLNQASLTAKLADGSAGLVHGMAPYGARYPLCLFSKQAGTATMQAFGGDYSKSMLWIVKGVVHSVSKGSASPAEDIDNAAEALLHYANLNISGADDMYLARESDIEYVEADGDDQYWHVGGLYRLIVQDT